MKNQYVIFSYILVFLAGLFLGVRAECRLFLIINLFLGVVIIGLVLFLVIKSGKLDRSV